MVEAGDEKRSSLEPRTMSTPGLELTTKTGEALRNWTTVEFRALS
ncbi:MAG: hypothetical protein QMD00_02140 [Hadesarchaea archaeon]|nr:hypothetical protein [Hadesarchaea archaeon]